MKPIPANTFPQITFLLNDTAKLSEYQQIGGEVVTLTVEREETVWEFPQERFVTYEPKDEAMCRFCGWGREVTKTVTYEHRMACTGVAAIGDAFSIEFTGI